MMAGRKMNILIVDDEMHTVDIIAETLAGCDLGIFKAYDKNGALKAIASSDIDIVVTDLKLKNESGIEVVETLKKRYPSSLAIVITAYATVDSAVEAMKKGAYDYITKPFRPEYVKMIIERALENIRLSKKIKDLELIIGQHEQFSGIIGRSAVMKEVFEQIDLAASTDSNVLIFGESGTGKELAAKAIHKKSARSTKPFIVKDCGIGTRELLASELFGYVKGAFTGANETKKGLFELAEQGTLFLDEISTLDVDLQSHLLRAIQEREIRPVGAGHFKKIDVRFIAATNKDLSVLIGGGSFRQDLYFRINVININLPPLRARRDDIPLLLDYFVNKYSHALGKKVERTEKEVLDIFMRYPWPGNVRELENAVERAVLFMKEGILTAKCIPEAILRPDPEASLMPNEGNSSKGILKNLYEVEKEHILDTLKKCGGNQKRCSEVLGISRKTLWEKLKKYGIKSVKNFEAEGGPQ